MLFSHCSLDYLSKGLPDLKQQVLFSQSGSSIPSNHKPVSLSLLEFKLVTRDLSLPRSLLYDAVRLGSCNANSEDDILFFVRLALLDAIGVASLNNQLKLLGEASLSSSLRADFLVLSGDMGFPVGVIEVKKPDATTDPKKETRIFGELYDYMMFLKSTYNLTRIFGVLTRYSDWYICSLESDQPASSSPNSSLCSRKMETLDMLSPVDFDPIPRFF